MRAYKCDRCGKYFDSKQGCIIKHSVFEKTTAHPVEWDLCYDCYDKFLEFMKNDKNNSIFNERGKEMLRKIGADKETVTEGYLGKV